MLARRWIWTRLLPGAAVAVALLFLVAALWEQRAADNARTADPVAGNETRVDVCRDILLLEPGSG